MTTSPDYFGLTDKIKALNAPVGLDAVHKPGYSWAVQGQYYSDTTKIGAPDWNAIIAQFRGLLTIDGVDLTDLSASSPLILREAIVRAIAAKVATSLPGEVTDQLPALEALLAADGDFVSAVGDATGLSTAEKAKLAYLTVTGVIDLDWVKSRLTALNSAQVFRGGWDASSGTFPGGGNAANGDVYTVGAAGTVDGVDFVEGDRISAITDNASTTTFAGNWFKEDYTDKVASVAGEVGAISAGALKAALAISYGEISGTPIEGSFRSAGNSYSNGASITLAHGLPFTPDCFSITAECISTELGFSVGDRVNVNFTWYIGSGSFYGASAVADATNVNVAIAANGLRTVTKDGTSSTSSAFTPARWKLIISAWKFS